MTEQEWLASTDPHPLIEFLRRKGSDRKLQLFAVACCREIWHLLKDDRSREAVGIAERFADGKANRQELAAAHDAAFDVFCAAAEIGGTNAHAAHAASAASADPRRVADLGLDPAVAVAGQTAIKAELASGADQEAACEEQSIILRCIFGPLPFRSVDSSPLTSTVVSLAQAIYEEKAFDRLPILADALEDAGCTDTDMLDHCRQPRVHVRGCWVVDLVLGKE